MEVILTGSVAFDYLMHFPGRIRDHILPDRLDSLSLSFLVDTLIRQRGGIAANIAYTLALLGERPGVMATVGEDFEEYRAWLEQAGVDTSLIHTVPGLFTASFFVTTDNAGAQVASFYTGAMARAAELHFTGLRPPPGLVMISPNDPGAMIAYVGECKSLSIPYFYDPSQQILRLEPGDLKEGIRGSAGLFVNDYEFALIQEKTHWGLEQILAETGFAVITRGEAGSDLYSGQKHWSIPAVPAEGLQDPTGVGDAFRGGFLKGYLHQMDLECCCKLGALAATLCAESPGPQSQRLNLPAFLERFEGTFGEDCQVSRLSMKDGVK
ncbi:MAG TPA: carbohydrate kinase family protein [Anaerolineales bacterium]|nr:carbohydrate kinase family protein [Anaerolineales bacterium]